MSLDLKVLLKYRYLLISFALLGVIAGAVYIRLVPPTYQAQARVLVKSKVLLPDTGEPKYDPEFLPTQAEMIRSPIAIERAIESMELTIPQGKPKETFDPVRHVLKSLQVTPVLKTNVLTLSYSGQAPEEECLAIIEGIVESYKHDVSLLDRGSSEVDASIIANREESLRQDLEQAQKDYAELRLKSPFLWQGREASDQTLMNLNQLGQQLLEVKRRRTELLSTLSALKSSTSASSVSTPTSGGVHVALKPSVDAVSSLAAKELMQFADVEEMRDFQEVDDRLRFAKLRAASLDGIYGPKHPELLAARAEVAEFEVLAEQRLQAIVDAWESELEITEATVLELTEEYEIEKQKMKDAEVFLVEEEHHRGKIAAIEQLHAATLEQILQADAAAVAVADGISTIEVRILDGPVIIQEMTWPNPKLLLPASLVLGLMAGMCVVVFREWSQTRSSKSSTLPSTSGASVTCVNQEVVGV